MTRRVHRGFEGRYVQQTGNSRRAHGLKHAAREFGVGAAKSRAAEAALVENPDQIDQHVVAAQAGLRVNDVIIAVGRTPVASVKTFREAAKGLNLLLLNVSRGSTVVLIPIR